MDRKWGCFMKQGPLWMIAEALCPKGFPQFIKNHNVFYKGTEQNNRGSKIPSEEKSITQACGISLWMSLVP